MKEPQVLIIGAAIIDVLVCPASEEVFRTGSYPAENIEMSVGADALNEATILAKLGKDVRLETVIGQDKAGKYIVNHCKEQNIQIEAHCIKPDLQTGINVVLVGEDGKRSFLTNPHGTLRRLTLDDITFPFPESVDIVCFASIFVFPEIRCEQLKTIFSRAKEQNKIVCADMTKCKNKETTADIADALQYVDYLFPNDEEAMLLTGKNSVEEAAEELKGTGVGNVIVKCGKRGCYVKSDVESVWIPAVENAACIDTTGAGDSFAAGFIYALSEGKSVCECARYGNECGAKAVGAVGATEWL